MGGGDLNMKKSWHPALLVNQDKVWQAEKKAADEKKKLQQLRKERDEERQLDELQRLQENQTGKKRVEKLDWMYAAPNANDGAMGGRFNERELEDYLLGKKRVDEVLKAGDRDVGNTSTDFIAVQNANTARDLASKVREDPMLAMKKAEQAALASLMNRPDIRRQLKAKKEREGESKDERRERRRAEKEERRRDRHERRHRHDDDRSDDDRERRRRDRDRDYGRDRDRDRDDRRRDRDSDRRRHSSRSVSPRRERDDRRRDSPRRYDRDDRRASPSPKKEPALSPRRERSPRRDSRNGDSQRSNGDYRNGDPRDHRNGDPRDHRNGDPRDVCRDDRNGDSRGFRNGVDRGERSGHSDYRNGHGRNGDARRKDERPPPPRRPSPERKPAGNPLDDMRAARLAAMSASADQLYAERSTKLAQRAQEEKKVFEAEERARSRYHKDEAAGMFMKHQEQMSGPVGLAETLQRRGGQGLLRDI